MPTILIVDDEQKIREFIGLFLRADKHRTFEAPDGKTALALFMREQIDLIILDVMLPDISGFELCGKIREQSSVPIIFLTALADEEYQMLGYRTEGDDYITKPFSAPILLAKIHRILQRCTPAAPPPTDILCFQGITLEKSSRRVLVDGQSTPMTPKEFDLLHILMKNAGRVLTRSTLLESVWGYCFAGDSRVVDSHIKKLRTKLGPYAANIKTVVSVGYKLEE